LVAPGSGSPRPAAVGRRADHGPVSLGSTEPGMVIEVKAGEVGRELRHPARLAADQPRPEPERGRRAATLVRDRGGRVRDWHSPLRKERGLCATLALPDALRRPMPIACHDRPMR
jgi:hypothetical protein